MSIALDTRQLAELQQALQPERRAVMGRLARLRRAVRTNIFVTGAMRLVALTVALLLVSLILDYWLRPERASRIALSLGAVGLIAAATWRWIIAPLRLRLDDLDLAELIERRRPGRGQQIVDVLQLPELLSTPDFASPALVVAAVRDRAQELQQIDLDSLIDQRRGTLHGLYLVGALLVPIVLVIFWFPTASLWARRWIFAENVRWPQATYLALEGLTEGNRLLAPRNESLMLQVTARPSLAQVDRGWQVPGRGEPLVIETKEPPEPVVPEQIHIDYRTPDGTVRQANFTHYEGATFRYELPMLAESLEVTIRGGDDWLGPILIEPIDRPAIKDLKLTAKLPGSAEEKIYSVGGADDSLVFLPETALQLRLAANQPLRHAEVLIKDEPTQSFERVAADDFRLGWTMQKSQTLELRLWSDESGLSSKPYFLTVGLLHDREPRLTLRSSGVGRRVTPQATIPLTIHAGDDFGLVDLGIELEKTDPTAEKTEKTEKPKPVTSESSLERWDKDASSTLPLSIDRNHDWKVVERELLPGQSIRLRAYATDRCALGDHRGGSRWLPFQIVTPEELFYEILMRQREQRTKFAAAIVQAQAQAEAIVALDAQDGVSALSRRHQAIARQVFQITSKLEAALREITLNDLGNPTARQLLADSVIAPLRELHAGPFEQQRQQLDRLAREDSLDEALRAGALETQQKIIRDMQQLLERMSQWEGFIDVVNQLRQIIKLQSQLKQGTEEVQKKQENELFDE